MIYHKNDSGRSSDFDFAIVGGGPVGAATAHFLSQKTKRKILLITKEPTQEPDHSAAYQYAGGSVRWFWNHKSAADRKRMTAMTKATADLARKLAKQGVDLSLLEDRYVFLTTGSAAPSLNISGAKLVRYFLNETKKRGVVVKEKTILASWKRDGDSYVLETSSGEFRAKNVLLAVGARETKKFLPKAKIELEKRELCVLDLPVNESRSSFPHLIAPFGTKDGVVYVFIKKTPDGLRMLLGEEDIVEHGLKSGGSDFLPALKRKGIEKVFPFLKGAKTEKVLWGFDAAHKFSQFDSDGHKLIAVTGGSAVRSCVAIGEMTAERMLKTLK